MMRKLAVLVLLVMAAGPVSSVQAEPGVLVDAQLVDTGDKQFLLKLRSTQPQAFDVERADDSVRVKLYEVELGDLSSLGSTPFGFAVFSKDSDKDVLLTLIANDPHYRVSVQQGGSAEVVDVRVVWVADITAPVISEVKTDEITSTSAVITWTTDEVSDSQAAYGKTQPETELSALLSDRTKAHRIKLTNLTPGQQYSFRVRSKDSAGNLTVSEASLFTTPFPAFKESGGLVVIEAESFDQNISKGVKKWTLQTDKGGGFAGNGYMAGLSNTGVLFSGAFAANSPQLVYSINFTQKGTYYVWVRGRGANGNDDSVHAGINGTAPASSDNMTGFTSTWSWRRTTSDGPVATISITKTGVQTFHLWMREDGFQVDRVLLRTSNSSTPPSGSGPAESPRTA